MLRRSNTATSIPRLELQHLVTTDRRLASGSECCMSNWRVLHKSNVFYMTALLVSHVYPLLFLNYSLQSAKCPEGTDELRVIGQQQQVSTLPVPARLPVALRLCCIEIQKQIRSRTQF